MNTKRSVRRTLAFTLAALALPLSASATTRVLQPIDGGPVFVEAGETIIVQSAATTPEQTRMDVTVSVDQGNQVQLLDTQCEVDQGTISCLNLGSAQMQAVDGVDNVWAFDPAILGLEDWSTDETPEDVRLNWAWQCKLELNDFSDCRNSCKAQLGDSFGAALTGIGPGCQLMCTCYELDGVTRITIPGTDTHVLVDPAP